MIYKYNESKEKEAVHKFIVKMGCIYGVAIIVNFVLFYFLLPFSDPNFQNIRWIFLILFPAMAVFCAFIIFFGVKRFRKNYRSYELEITDSKIIAVENSVRRELPLSEIKDIRQTGKNGLVVIGKSFTRIYITNYVESCEEITKKLSEIKEIKKDKKEKLIIAASWFFMIGLFAARFIPNIYVYCIFGFGFVVMSVISVYYVFCSGIKIFLKIVSALFYAYIDFQIIYTLIVVTKKILGS